MHSMSSRAFGGVTAVAAALVAQWLFGHAFERAPFPPYSYSDWFIRQAPGSLATEAIETLGPRARETLVFTSAAVLLAVGALASLVRPVLGPVSVFVVTIVGAWLAPVPSPQELSVLAAFVGAGMAAAIVALARLQPAGGAQEGSATRRTLLLGGLSGGFLALTGLAITANVRREPPRGLTASRRLNAVPGLRFIAIDGLSPLITSPEDHYIIDINVQRPRVPRAAWELRVNGLVESPLAVQFEELLTFDLEERAVLLQCISNWAAGHLIGNAIWTCFPFTSLLDRVKPGAAARWVLVRAYDGYFESFPLSEADSWLVAVGMGGRELPDDHGFPIRLLYPGHYGMRSVKWVTGLEFRAEDPGSYWNDRGWDREASMRIGSRIESPPPGSRDIASPVTIAGTAYGFDPITAVEVSFDDGGTWVPADLEPRADEHAWTRWQLTSPRPPGRQEIRARAYAGGMVQDAEIRGPHPSGSSGLDLRLLDVSDSAGTRP